MSDIPHTGKITRQREVRFGEYVLGATLGEGEFGKVKLGWRRDGRQPTQAAIKLIRRQTIPQGSEKQSKIHREVNALKRLRHPNIVRLVEVLQNDKYIGIVLEYASGGELFDYILEHRYLKEATACRLFAQLVSGVDYMHTKGLVHRDLKLENLLLDKHKNIIISDFGFVNSFHGRTDLMRTSCGSPCYAAPELVVSSRPYRGTRVDVWSCGVILYAMLAGYLPWDDDPSNPDGENIARLYRYITSTALTFPEYIGAAPRDLLRRILVPDPHARLSLRQVRGHPWLAPHAMFLSVSPGEWDRNYRAARLLVSQPDAAHRRYSLMEAPLALRDSRRATSLMINPHSIRSRSSSKGGQPALAARSSLLLYSDPAAPHTSHTVAISRSPRSKAGTATASGSADEYDDDAGDEGDEEDDEDDELAERVSHKMHSNAPHHYRLSAAHQPHSQLSAQEAREEMAAGYAHPDTTHDISHDSTRADHPRHRRDSSSASVALQAVVAADAAERSTHGSRHSHPRPVTMAGYGSAAGTHHSSRSAAIAPIAEGSISGSAADSSRSTRAVPRFRPRASRPRPTSFQPAMVSASSAFTARDFSFLVKPVKGSAPSPSGSPVQSKRSSWCQPKISQPALDMSLVSGVLTGPGDESSGREKRHSVALDSLSSMMNSEEKAPLARSSRSESTASVYGSPVHKERADHVEGNHVKGAHTEKPHIPATRSTTQSTARSTSHSSTSTTPHTTARSTTHTSTNSEKENRTLGSVTSKFKRFSLLSFYGHDTHEPAHHRHTGHRHDERRASRKPLEPRNQSEHEQREPSAAKRVMDFFRRRSIRI